MRQIIDAQSTHGIKTNSIVYTSGAGNLFKAGLPLGKLSNNELSDEKKVEFFSDFSQLKFVKIISFKKSENK